MGQMRSGMISKGLLLGGVALGVLSVTGAVRAADDQSGSISEIIVTANKQAEKLHDVGQEVSAVTGADMATRNQTDFHDFAAEVPGFQIQEASPVYNREILRGQNSGGSGATVATVVDDMPLSFSGSDNNAALVSTNLDTYDLQRIEVLKGPQGTLYGATAEGGVVKYVTTPPSLTQYQAGIEGSAYNVDHGQSSGSVKGYGNIPIVDGMVGLRVTAFEEGIPGYIDNPYLGEHNVNRGEKTGGRASLLVAPNDKLTVRLMASQQLLHTDGINQVEAVGNGMWPAAPAPANELALANGYVNNSLYDQTQDSRISYYYADVEYDFGFANLSSISSYGTVQASYVSDYSGLNAAPGLSYQAYLEGALGTPLGLRDTQRESLSKESQEIRLTSSPGEKLFGNEVDWIVGAFGTREFVGFSQVYDFTNVPVPGGPVSTLSTLPPAGGLAQPSNYEEWAFFGQVDYHFLPDFDIAAGMRISGDHVALTANFQGGVLLSPSPTVGPVISDEHSTTWSVAPRWHLSDDTLLYGRVATGYRPGGPNLIIPGLPTVLYNSDSTMNYEIGGKSYFFNKTVDIDIAAYDIQWSHIQINSVVNTSTGPITVVGNAGSAASRGVEWTLGWRPIKGLSFTDAGSYSDAHLSEDAPALGGSKGDQLAYVPHWSNTLNADYEWDAFNDFKGFGGIGWTYTGTRYSDFYPAGVNETHVRLPSYNQINLQAGIRDARYTIELFARNVTDEKGISSYINTGAFNETGELTLIQPRTIGLRVAATY